MAYFKLQCKKVVKNTLTWLILGVVLLGIGLILAYNATSGGQSTIKVQVTQDLNQQHQDQSDQAILTAIDRGKWPTAYRLMIKQNKEHAAQVKGNTEFRQDIKEKNIRLQALLRAKVPEEDEQRPKSGWLFLFKLMDAFLPALLILMLCFVLSNLFASHYVDQLNRASLLPCRHLVILDFGLGLLVAGSLTLIVVLVAGGSSSLFFGSGSLSYPLLGTVLPNGQPQYRPLSAWLSPTLILTVLSGIFIVLLVLFLAQVSRNQLTCLFLSLVILLGGMILPLILQSMQKMTNLPQTSPAQYIPMTYLLSSQVATGSLGTMLRDPQLNFAFGCQVLVITIVVLAVLNLFWPKLAHVRTRN